MRVVVNDANVLIDLVELHLLPHFFALYMEFHTTSFILDELLEKQIEDLKGYIDNGDLIVDDVTEEDFQKITKLRLAKPILSEQDCSALQHAKNRNAILLTSDNNLRKFAKTQDVDVHGHFWIFDRMVEYETISPKRASEKLTELCDKVNPKLGLPEDECQKRHKAWLKQR